MALIGYTITVVAKQDNPYNVLPETDISIRKNSDNTLVNIYADEAGLIPIAQLGAKTDSNGQFTFYADASLGILKAVWTNGGVIATEVLDKSDHSRLVNRNAVGAHDAIYRRETTVAEIATGVFSVGDKLAVTDRGLAKFNIVGGGTANGYDILEAGVGKTAVLQVSKGRATILEFGGVSGQNASDVINRMMQHQSVQVIQNTDKYVLTSQVLYESNKYIVGTPDSMLTVSDTVSTSAITAIGKSNVGYYNLRMTGAGKAFLNGNERLCAFVNCTNLYGDKFYGYDSTNHGLVIETCKKFQIYRTQTERCYGIGLQTRYACDEGIVDGLLSLDNGYPSGGDIGPQGRGYLTWKCTNISHSNFVISGSSEYGLRCYSETGDTEKAKNLTFTNMTISDSGKTDLFIFNEAQLQEEIQFVNVMINTTGTGKKAIALEGNNVTVSGITMRSLTPQSNTAITFSKGSNLRVIGGTVENFGTLVSYGATDIANGCSIQNITGSGLIEVAGAIVGDDHDISNNKFDFHSSTTLPAIALSDSYSTVIDNNTFDGAYQCISLNSSQSFITNNRSKNTINVPVRKFGTSVSGMNVHSNSWDKNCSPREFGVVDIIKRGESVVYVTGYTVVNPTALTNIDWPLRTKFYAMDQGLLSGFEGWIKTASGNPGTWKTFGVISS